MSPVPIVKLNNGVSIPAVGLGVWAGFKPEDISQAKSWVLSALKVGYRHIDTALMYGTEGVVGEAIKESGIPREEIVITTKLPWNHHGSVSESFEISRQNLGVEYIDLYLVHWPQSVIYEDEENPLETYKIVDSPTFHDSWAELEKLLASGKVKAIGVSNFSIKTLEELFETAKVTPAVNQVEMHPYLTQNDLVEFCAKKGIIPTAYTPTGYANVRDNPLIVELAAKYKASTAQIVLAWHLARGTVVVPKSANIERQKENINLPTLDAEDVNKITGLDRGERLFNKPDEHGMVWGWTTEQIGW